MNFKIKSLAALAGAVLMLGAVPAEAAPRHHDDRGHHVAPPRHHGDRHVNRHQRHHHQRWRTVCKKKWVHGHRQRVCWKVRR